MDARKKKGLYCNGNITPEAQSETMAGISPDPFASFETIAPLLYPSAP